MGAELRPSPHTGILRAHRPFWFLLKALMDQRQCSPPGGRRCILFSAVAGARFCDRGRGGRGRLMGRKRHKTASRLKFEAWPALRWRGQFRKSSKAATGPGQA